MKQAFAMRKLFDPIAPGTPKKDPEVHYYATSQSPAQCTLADAADIMRGHWGIESVLHWRKDAVMGEDRHNLRTGAAPYIFSILRTAALTLLDFVGIGAFRSGSTPEKMAFISADPARAVALLSNIKHLATM